MWFLSFYDKHSLILPCCYEVIVAWGAVMVVTNFRDGSIERASFAGPHGERGYDLTHAASYASLTLLPCTVCVYVFRSDEVSQQRNGRRLGGFSDRRTD